MTAGNRVSLKGLKYAWLSPAGKLVIEDREFDGSLDAYHEKLATCIVRDLKRLKSARLASDALRESGCHYATEYLEEKRWIRLQGFGGMRPRWVVPEWQRITKAQEVVIVDWCAANNRKYEEAFSR